MLPTTPQRATHDDERNGTIDLFAALEVATGKVITQLRPSHTSAEFVVFLNKINREVPAGLDVHVVLDNLSTHKTPAVHEWLLRHKRFHFHFTPTYGSWMNLVEGRIARPNAGEPEGDPAVPERCHGRGAVGGDHPALLRAAGSAVRACRHPNPPEPERTRTRRA
jgi:hypothetical protein